MNAIFFQQESVKLKEIAALKAKFEEQKTQLYLEAKENEISLLRQSCTAAEERAAKEAHRTSSEIHGTQGRLYSMLRPESAAVTAPVQGSMSPDTCSPTERRPANLADKIDNAIILMLHDSCFIVQQGLRQLKTLLPTGDDTYSINLDDIAKAIKEVKDSGGVLTKELVTLMVKPVFDEAYADRSPTKKKPRRQ